MNRSLYEISTEIESVLARLIDGVNEETGEVDEEVLRELSDLEASRAEKLENIGCFIKNQTAEALAIKAEIDALKKRYDSKIKAAESLSRYVSEDLQRHDEKKFESARVMFSFRKSEAVTISDEASLPKKYLTKEVKFKPNRVAIKEALKSGLFVRGATIEIRQNLQIK